jgi:hypothetical protein
MTDIKVYITLQNEAVSFILQKAAILLTVFNVMV